MRDEAISDASIEDYINNMGDMETLILGMGETSDKAIGFSVQNFIISDSTLQTAVQTAFNLKRSDEGGKHNSYFNLNEFEDRPQEVENIKNILKDTGGYADLNPMGVGVRISRKSKQDADPDLKLAMQAFQAGIGPRIYAAGWVDDPTPSSSSSQLSYPHKLLVIVMEAGYYSLDAFLKLPVITTDVGVKLSEIIHKASTKGFLLVDIKPTNVIVLDEGKLLMIDFDSAFTFRYESPSVGMIHLLEFIHILMFLFYLKCTNKIDEIRDKSVISHLKTRFEELNFNKKIFWQKETLWNEINNKTLQNRHSWSNMGKEGRGILNNLIWWMKLDKPLKMPCAEGLTNEKSIFQHAVDIVLDI